MGDAAVAAIRWVVLTETDIVGEEMQKALTLFLPVATGIARAPGSYAGS